MKRRDLNQPHMTIKTYEPIDINEASRPWQPR